MLGLMAPRVDVPVMTTEPQPFPSLTYTDSDHPSIAVLDGQDQCDGIEAHVYQRLDEHLKGALPTYLPTTDNDSGNEEHTTTEPRKNTKALQTTVINQVTSPHELI